MSVEADPIRDVIARLARPDASGGYVIGHAAILAEGTDFSALRAWILDHGGASQRPALAAASRGLHGTGRTADPGQAVGQAHYTLPAGALD